MPAEPRGLRLPVDVLFYSMAQSAAATRRMKQMNPAIRVIALADDHDLHRLEKLLGSGINAYILRRNAPDELIPAIRAVMATGVNLGDPRRSRESAPAARRSGER